MKVIVIGFIGLLLVLSACVQQNPQAPTPSTPIIQAPVVEANKTVPQQQAAPCSKGSILEKDDCFIALAKSNNEVSICDGIYSADKKDECIFAFAKTDGKLCDSLFASGMRSECFLIAARATKDFQTCAKIGNDATRATCLRELSPPCSFETDEVAKGRCLAFEKSDYTFCKDTNCEIDYAYKYGNDGACNLISESELASRYACFALARNSSSWCARAGDKQAVSDYCYQIFAQKTDDYTVCGLATIGSSYRNSCYLYFALKETSPAICKKAAPEESRDDCYANYSVSKNDVATCDMVINSLNRAKCYIFTAKENGNPAACNKMLYGTLDSCMVQVLTRVGLANPSYCANVSDSLWRDKCYVNAAEKFRNETLCAFINDADQLAKCKKPFAYE